ncbi:MAG: DNA gyrase inhibitor YacG [Planctomycetes bacterium]|nr:DNA gyrase inhibitor YacG [Planctomycetota bacterium]
MNGSTPCPICGHSVGAEAPSFPFCGDRCRLIDLGNWLEGRHRIPGEPVALPEGPAEEEAGEPSDPARD